MNSAAHSGSFVKTVAEAHLVKLLPSRWIEHAEAIIEVGLSVPIDLPGEGQRDVQSVIHVVCGRAMCKVACSAPQPLSLPERDLLAVLKATESSPKATPGFSFAAEV